jgi:hypothetical protein
LVVRPGTSATFRETGEVGKVDPRPPDVVEDRVLRPDDQVGRSGRNALVGEDHLREVDADRVPLVVLDVGLDDGDARAGFVVGSSDTPKSVAVAPDEQCGERRRGDDQTTTSHEQSLATTARYD